MGNLVFGMLAHVGLLLTFRHDLSGLPRKSCGLVYVVVAISALLNGFLMDNPWSILKEAAALVLVGSFVSVRTMVGFALISGAFDVLFMTAGLAPADIAEPAKAILVAWQYACLIRVMYLEFSGKHKAEQE